MFIEVLKRENVMDLIVDFKLYILRLVDCQALLTELQTPLLEGHVSLVDRHLSPRAHLHNHPIQ